MFYGSGILYNLINTGTTGDFNKPLLSTGLGFTFYNNLDLNLSYGIPLQADKTFKDNFSNYFINVGFDIQFTEYIKKVNEKRKVNKLQKRIEES